VNLLHCNTSRPDRGRRVIWGRDVGSTDANFKVLVIGGIHGDEMSSHLGQSLAGVGDDSALRLAANIHWRLTSSLNPDGLFARPARRTNGNGVDLNRNFPTPTTGARDAKVYWEQRTKRDPRRWPGNKAVSEPESRFLLEQMDNFKPNLIVSVHAPYGVLDFDGPSVPPSKLGRLYLDQVGIFPGSLG